jgi:hypothetical protein
MFVWGQGSEEFSALIYTIILPDDFSLLQKQWSYVYIIIINGVVKIIHIKIWRTLYCNYPLLSDVFMPMAVTMITIFRMKVLKETFSFNHIFCFIQISYNLFSQIWPNTPPLVLFIFVPWCSLCLLSVCYPTSVSSILLALLYLRDRPRQTDRQMIYNTNAPVFPLGIYYLYDMKFHNCFNHIPHVPQNTSEWCAWDVVINMEEILVLWVHYPHSRWRMCEFMKLWQLFQHLASRTF